MFVLSWCFNRFNLAWLYWVSLCKVSFIEFLIREFLTKFTVPLFRLTMQDFQIMSDFSSIARQRKCPCFMSVSVCSLHKISFLKYTCSLTVVFIFYSIDVWKLGQWSTYPTFFLDHSSITWLVKTFFLHSLWRKKLIIYIFLKFWLKER